ncbi:hypothetical protein D3C73_900610 [compost metagenome]
MPMDHKANDQCRKGSGKYSIILLAANAMEQMSLIQQDRQNASQLIGRKKPLLQNPFIEGRID